MNLYRVIRPRPFHEEVKRSLALLAGYYFCVIAAFLGDARWLIRALISLLAFSVSVGYLSRHQRHRDWHGGRIAILWASVAFPYVAIAGPTTAALASTGPFQDSSSVQF